MNDDLQKQLADLLAKLMTVAQDGATWAGQQIPPLVQEKILYGRVVHSLYVVLFAIVAWRAAVSARGFFQQACAQRAAKSKSGFDSDIWPDRPGGLASIACALVTMITAGIALANVQRALLVWLAPRLYIVEWLADLVKK